MKEKFSGFWEGVKTRWMGTSKKMRILFLSALAGISLVALAVVMVLNHTDYIALYSSLDVTESAEVLAMLQEMGVDSKLENDRILIPAESEMYVRMQMAMKGYPDAGFDYATFEKGSSLTSTQFEKTYYATAQLQDRLQATIKTFPEVQNAIVTLSIPETSNYVLQKDVEPPAASVKITKRPGRDLTAEQVRGILNIVKNSVNGLTEENISISDEAGDLKGTLGLGLTAHDQKLALTEQVNETVRRRVMELIAPIYGEGKFTVAVNSVLDTDSRITDKTTYIPWDENDPTRNPLDYSEHLREGSGQDPVVEGVPGANDNVDVPQYAAQEEDLGANGYYSRQDIYDYLVSSVRDQIVKEGLYIENTTVAVIIDSSVYVDGQRDQIIDSVATAAGIDRDNVSVQTLKFLEQRSPEELPDQTLQKVMIFSGIALLILIIIVVIVLMLLSKRRKEREAADQAAYEEEQATLVELMAQQGADYEPITLVETQEQKLRTQIRELAESDPEIVAQLIKTWLLND